MVRPNTTKSTNKYSVVVVGPDFAMVWLCRTWNIWVANVLVGETQHAAGITQNCHTDFLVRIENDGCSITGSIAVMINGIQFSNRPFHPTHAIGLTISALYRSMLHFSNAIRR